MVEYLDYHKPVFTCIYFHAKWNPMCANLHADYDNFVGRTGHFTHLKVDCDETPKVKFYFDARVEPQFLILLNGTEFKR